MRLNNQIEWVSWSFISQTIKQRELSLVVWGKSEDWLPKVLRKHIPELIIDSNKSLDGDEYEGIPIVSPGKLKRSDWDGYYVVICTSAFQTIREELENYGLIENKNFSVLPDLKDIQLVEDVASFSCEFLVTSSDHDNSLSQRGSNLGGGIYHCILDSNGLVFEKKISGQYREIKFHQEKFYAIDGFSNRLTVFDKNYNILEEVDIRYSNCCGIEIIDEYIYIANSSRDSIIVFDSNLNQVSESFISPLASEKGNSRHHINDLSSINNQLIVTMFSRSGFWRDGVFDGHLVSLSSELKIDQTLYSGLSQPHTPRVFDGEVAFADSFSGGLVHGTKGTILQVDGFVRGIEKVGSTWILGQSQTLYLERRVGVSGKVFLNTGVYIYNEASKVYAFHSMPGIKNIHSLLII
jgi:hypothetical protein